MSGGAVDAGASRSGLVDDVQKIFQGIGRRTFAGIPVYKVYQNKQVGGRMSAFYLSFAPSELQLG